MNEMSKHTVIKLYTSLIPLLNLDKFAKLICNVVKLKLATKWIPSQGLGPVIDYRGRKGGGGNEKLDVNILLPPPLSHYAQLYMTPHAITKCR